MGFCDDDKLAIIYDLVMAWYYSSLPICRVFNSVVDNFHNRGTCKSEQRDKSMTNNFWHGKEVFVTGGAGFIGSHLVEQLKDYANVLVLDDFSRGHTVFGGVDYWRNDLRDPPTSLPINIDVFFHLAAKVTSIEYNRHNHYDMLMTNLAINYNAVELAKHFKPKLFAFTSTACVYPHNAPVPTPESAASVCDPEPTNVGYGISKWVGEQMTQFLHQEHNINSLVFRFFNAFGERDYYDEATSHVAPALIKRVVDGENPIVVWGTGEQTRVLVDAADIAKSMIMLAEVAYDSPTERPLTVNIGHSREVSIKDLAQAIANIAGSDASLEFDTSKPDGYPRRSADTTLMKSLIGWEPDTPLETTLEKMIQEYRRSKK